MAGRRLLPGRGGGGDGIPARGQDRTRLAAAGVALALLGLVGAYAALSAPRWQAAAAGLAAGAVVLLGAALRLWRPAWISAAVLLGGAAYGVAVVARDPAFDSASIPVAALLLLVAELGIWSVELAAPVRYGPALLTRRAGLVAALALVSLCAAAAVGAAAAQEAEPGLGLGALGVGAAVAVVAVIARLSRT